MSCLHGVYVQCVSVWCAAVKRRKRRMMWRQRKPLRQNRAAPTRPNALRLVWSVLQCVGVVVCCSVACAGANRTKRTLASLECLVVCRSVLQCVSVCRSVLQCIAVCRICSCQQDRTHFGRSRVCCSVLQCIAVCHHVSQSCQQRLTYLLFFVGLLLFIYVPFLTYLEKNICIRLFCRFLLIYKGLF